MSIQVHVRVFSLHLVLLLLLLLLHHLLLLLLGELLDLLWCPAPLSVLTRLECPRGQTNNCLVIAARCISFGAIPFRMLRMAAN
jgi:hypothetical protein